MGFLVGQSTVVAPEPEVVVILVDDGIATGTTVRAALVALSRLAPRRRVLAVPVAPPDTLERLAAEAEEIVALEQPEWMGAVGQFYRDFTQTEDAEVIRLLAEAARRLKSNEAAARQAAHRMRCRFRHLLRLEGSQTVGTAEEVEEELTYLPAALAA